MEPTLLNLKISENQPKIAGPPKIVGTTGFEPRQHSSPAPVILALAGHGVRIRSGLARCGRLHLGRNRHSFNPLRLCGLRSYVVSAVPAARKAAPPPLVAPHNEHDRLPGKAGGRCPTRSWSGVFPGGASATAHRSSTVSMFSLERSRAREHDVMLPSSGRSCGIPRRTATEAT
jgi:hypothetical protein